MKVIIIGGVAGGASTAARLRRLNEHAEIIIFERGKNISFANCGIPYYAGGVIKEREKLEILTPQKIKEILNIDARIETEVIKINRNKKTVIVKNLITGKEYEEKYDKLVLSPGAKPIKPPLKGIESKKVFTIRNLDDADKIKKKIEEEKFVCRGSAYAGLALPEIDLDYLKSGDLNSLKTVKAAIIGAGYIGLEMAENLAHLGIEVTIIEMCPQILNNVDIEIAAQIQNHMSEKGVNILLEEAVESFSEGNKLKINLRSGQTIEADFAVLAIGVKPENKLAVESGLEIGKLGGIKVNEYLQTSDPDIYALGDAIEVKDFVSGNDSLIPLAGPANRQGRIVAENLCGITTKYEATQGTAILKLFDLVVGMTGNNEKQLKRNNISYQKVYAHNFSHAEYYPNAYPITIKLLFSPENEKILGAQVIGKEGVDKRTDVIAMAIGLGGSIRDLIDAELTYAPPFGSAKDPVNVAGMIAENMLTGKVKPVFLDETNKINDEFFILDVRADDDFKKVSGSLENTYRIPLEHIRSRLSEVPTNKKILVYCAKGLKSYYASRILIQNGFQEVYSLNGGYLTLKSTLTKNKNKIGLAG